MFRLKKRILTKESQSEVQDPQPGTSHIKDRQPVPLKEKDQFVIVFCLNLNYPYTLN